MHGRDSKERDRTQRSARLTWRNTLARRFILTAKASVPLGQSHINTWDRVARSGQLPARLQHAILALSPVTYISTPLFFSLVLLASSISLSLPFFASFFVQAFKPIFPPLPLLVRIYLREEHSKLLFLLQSAKGLRIYRPVNVRTGCSDIRIQRPDPWSLIVNVYTGSAQAHASMLRWKMNDR